MIEGPPQVGDLISVTHGRLRGCGGYVTGLSEHQVAPAGQPLRLETWVVFTDDITGHRRSVQAERVAIDRRFAS